MNLVCLHWHHPTPQRVNYLGPQHLQHLLEPAHRTYTTTLMLVLMSWLIFLNLILNAAEAMQHGGKLQIATTAIEQGVTVTFTDSGPGMTEEQREHAFTGMLSSTKDKGGGLGLAIVAKVAEAHGGRVEVESVPGEGTRIILRLHA